MPKKETPVATLAARQIGQELCMPTGIVETFLKQFGEDETRTFLSEVVLSAKAAGGRDATEIADRARNYVRDASKATVDEQIAPSPAVDRQQQVLGSSLTMEVVSAFSRSGQYGYRTWYVDLLEELLERELHGFGVLSQRNLAVSGAKLEFEPAYLPAGNARIPLARAICEETAAMWKGLSGNVVALSELMWGVYYGPSAQETCWARSAGQEWPTSMHLIHSRRLNYAVWQDWECRIWDQGAVTGYGDMLGNYPSTQLFGTRVNDWPGKIVFHTPKLRATYPTRDGLGRLLIWWFALKGMAARSASIYIERFAKPWPIASYATGKTEQEHRVANQKDIDIAYKVAIALGQGTASSGVIPDSIKMQMQGPGAQNTGRAGLTHGEYFDFINSEISKATLGQTLTTEAGPRGNMGATEIHKAGSKEIARYDAAVLADSIKRGVIAWFVRLNWPNDPDLVPQTKIATDESPDPVDIADVLIKAVMAGLPIDADKVTEMLGLPLIPQVSPDKLKPGEVPEPRRAVLVRPLDLSVGDSSIEPTVTKPSAIPVTDRSGGKKKV